MKKMKRNGSAARPRSTTSPVTQLEQELVSLRRDLRATVRAYAARLEIELAETTAAVVTETPAENLSRERLHQIRDLTMLVRNRKVKPQKGRRKDLRKIDGIIADLHSATHPHPSR
jgi:hypothetical protein